MQSSGVWILAEQKAGQVQRISFELLTRGLRLAEKSGSELSAMIFASSISENELEGLIEGGADRVICIESPHLNHFMPAPYTECMIKVIEQYRPEIIIAGATSTGRTLMPYVAVKATTGLTADCTELDIEEVTGNLLQTRPAIGGNIMATIKTPSHRPQMATVRPHSTKPAERVPGRKGKGQIIRLESPSRLAAGPIQYKDFIANEDSLSLADADTVVAVGRGIKKADNLSLIYNLADALGAAVAASRAVIDRGWLSYQHQVGLSGQTVSPKLYIAIGISGAIQHLAGMQTAENIIVVNSDPDAQIFKLADFGIVGDLFEVVPLMTERIQKRGGASHPIEKNI